MHDGIYFFPGDIHIYDKCVGITLFAAQKLWPTFIGFYVKKDNIIPLYIENIYE